MKKQILLLISILIIADAIAQRQPRVQKPNKPDTIKKLPVAEKETKPVIRPIIGTVTSTESGVMVPVLATRADVMPQPAFEDIVVYRIQLRVTVGSGSESGTDNPVYTQLNNRDPRFYLVKGVDNFEAGRTYTYDVLSENIKRVRDIEVIRFGIKGDDGFAMFKVELFLNNNGAAVFSKTFGGSGLSIDNNSTQFLPTIEISGFELRAYAWWKYHEGNQQIWLPPRVISKAWITSVVEASLGNKLQYMGAELQWGTTGGVNTIWGDAVEANMVNDHTLHIDLDLQRDVVGPNPEVDVDFNLDFHCTNGSISFDVENMNVQTSLAGKVREFVLESSAILVTGALTVYTGGMALPTLMAALMWALNNGFATPRPDGSMIPASCTRAFVASNGDILLQ